MDNYMYVSSLIYEAEISMHYIFYNTYLNLFILSGSCLVTEDEDIKRMKSANTV